MTESPTHILVIKSAPSEVNKVEAFLEKIFEEYDFPKNCFNKVFLCVSEAVTNSIVHGNRKNVQKEIKVHIKNEVRSITVTVTDEGEGFDVNTIPDPTKKENILKESGRGIHIIKSLCNSLSFNEKGNSLQFQISCQ